MKIRWLLALAFCALIATFLAPEAYRKWSARGPGGVSLTRSTRMTGELPPAYVRSLRPIYPYSVIPGGAYSPQELRFANSQDEVVQAHYADFDMKNAWVVRLTAERLAYASYRVRDQIFWTAKKLKIPQGEYLLTDGVHYARARCGNRLSEQPQGEISALEPAAAVLSQPDFQPNFVAKLDLGEGPALSQGVPSAGDAWPHMAPSFPAEDASPVLLAQSPEFIGGAIPQPFGLPPFVGITGKTAGTPVSEIVPPVTPGPPAGPSPVPEPASIYLFLITFVVVLWVLTRVMKAEHKSDSE